MNCHWCERKLNNYWIEIAWIDNIDENDVHIERYCSSKCIKEVMN